MDLLEKAYTNYGVLPTYKIESRPLCGALSRLLPGCSESMQWVKAEHMSFAWGTYLTILRSRVQRNEWPRAGTSGQHRDLDLVLQLGVGTREGPCLTKFTYLLTLILFF
jgi:hypothetical protein